ncbi:MAG: hypothetical protein WC586_07695 [Methanoregula sp.]
MSILQRVEESGIPGQARVSLKTSTPGRTYAPCTAGATPPLHQTWR